MRLSQPYESRLSPSESLGLRILLIQQSDLVQSSFCLAKFHPMTPILEKELCNVALPVLCNVALPVLCNVALPVLCNVALRSGSARPTRV